MITENIRQIKQKIDSAAVKLIAVTKNHDVAAMREAIDAGVTDIGENRIQEAMNKFAVLDRRVVWHLIGHLQTNKVKQAVRMFALIHSVDSRKLADEISRCAGLQDKVQDILIQVNVAEEESKFGTSVAEAEELVNYAAGLPNVRVCGLMMVAPKTDELEQVRPYFRQMKQLWDKIRLSAGAEFKYLSMGMTNDYTVALDEGANMIRIGTGIFGQRQYNNGGGVV